MPDLRTGAAAVLSLIVFSSLLGAAPAPAEFRLWVGFEGDGGGSVTSEPEGISCAGPLGCEAIFEEGTVVALTASAYPGSMFLGWSGACSGTGTCIVTMTQDMFVTASFNAPGIYVQRVGDGDGTVESSPGGIDCGVDCYEEYEPGTVVTLSATADAGSSFLGWSGGCSGNGDCVLEMTQDYHGLEATFGALVLTVSTSGDGSGRVTSSPPGIKCGDGAEDCGEAFEVGTEVTLIADPGPASGFAGWSGDCSGTEPCVLTIADDHVVDAAFDTGRVTASLDGDGSGTLVSDPAGIDCPPDCSESFVPGTSVTLSPSAGEASTFTGWSGSCSGTGACVLDAASDPTVTGVFDTGWLDVTRDGFGAGTVQSDPPGIDCGLDCLEAYLPGTVVTLTATPQAGSTFAGWSGDCSGTEACVLTLGDASVTATFNPPDVDGKIVWECAGDICVMNANGSGRVNLTEDLDGVQYGPALSPDGQQVAFSSNASLTDNPDRNWEIATIQIDGTGLSQVTNTGPIGSDPYQGSYDPSWSPDGTRLAFSSYRQSPHFYQIFTINPDGSGEAQITPSDFFERTGPVWSRDGSKIAYTSKLSQADVYEMNADGSDPINLTPDTLGSDDEDPAWSPDGTRFAYTTDRHYDPLTFNTDIYVRDADGTNPVRVTDHEMRDRDASWSPDGTQILFSSSRGGTYDIWAVDAPPPTRKVGGAPEDGLREMVTRPGADLEPAWGAPEPAYSLTIKKTGQGDGLVKSKPAGIRCGSDCSEAYEAGTRVKLVARPEPGSSFARWSLPSCGPSRVCVVTIDDVMTVRARFEVGIRPTPRPHPLV